jgi:uncharacterized protein YwqG
MAIFDDLLRIGKIPVIAQIGGFRPDDLLRSSFGGNFLLKQGSQWPVCDQGPMLPVIQIMVSEVPNGERLFGEVKCIQVFVSSNRLPITPSKNGDGWLLIEHHSINDLGTVNTPESCNRLKCFQVKWSLADKPDYPCWEEAWDYLDLTEINASEELSERFFDEFDRYTQTKIGGYASYIQSPCLGDFEYVFQIASEDKPKFIVGDSGNIYILKSKTDGEWYLHWDCY